ncbi:toll/interleukin-1 receptor domain-containing protein [Lentzea sp. NPDC051838]|uniref:toll/interleukin-1 receptor domain-containing protein n=1 Tax=Lentzea sp. NPDC051838 TaxID=3154849 RepID=UPI003412D134
MTELDSRSMFLSHNAEDKPFVRRLAMDLKAEGVKVWFDEAEIKAGESLLYKIQDGIEEIDYVVAVLSPTSIASSWVQTELEMAMVRQIDERQVRVVPILYRDCAVPLFLRGKLYLDFRRDEKYWQVFERLLDVALPGRKKLFLTGKEAARRVKTTQSPPGGLVGLSQRGMNQDYYTNQVMSDRDWVHADAKSGRSRMWVAEYYNEADRTYRSYGVYDERITAMPYLNVKGEEPPCITRSFVDSDRAIATAVKEAVSRKLVPNEDDFFLITKLRHYSSTGLVWAITFMDEALRGYTIGAMVDAYTGELKSLEPS